MMKRLAWIILCWAHLPYGHAETISGSGSNLPIGERKYVIDVQNQFAPVEIQAADAKSAKTFLKDPNLKDLSKLAEPLGKKNNDSKQVFVKKVKSHPKAIRFDALNVTGERSGPRVQFTQETLSIGRTDEPLSSNFFEKVFEPISDDNF